ncbi:MAG: polysaccharide biosynthesis/export family protein [Paludibacteraceae bacterium]|nr:polysaccharide biosynthesis/export family protein [Paludibacteraceae bacterium]
MMQELGKDIPTYDNALSYEDYLLRKGDRLYIYVYSIDERTASLFNSGMTNSRQMVRNSMGAVSDLYTYVIDDNGNIQFPTIGDVPALGKTTRQMKYLLEEELSGLVKSLGNQSMVSVEVQVVQRSFSIIGPTRSGRYSLNKEKVTIFEALAMCGDLSDIADRREVMLIREINDSTIVKTFDLRSKSIVNSEFYYIEPNDVIYIRYMKGYSFGINHVSSAIGLVASTISFGVFIYSFVDKVVRKIQNSTQLTPGINQ